MSDPRTHDLEHAFEAAGRRAGGGGVMPPAWAPPVTPHVRTARGLPPQFGRRLMRPLPTPRTFCGAGATAYDVLRGDLPRIERAGQLGLVCELCRARAGVQRNG